MLRTPLRDRARGTGPSLAFLTIGDEGYVNSVQPRFSDLAVIAMHYPERFEENEICEAFVKAHPHLSIYVV